MIGIVVIIIMMVVGVFFFVVDIGVVVCMCVLKMIEKSIVIKFL